MVISAGLVILFDNKILLVHPTNQRWYETYSIPKGEVKEGEELLTAAFREAEEELGIKLADYSLYDIPQWIEYRNGKGKLYKKVCYFIMYLENEPKDFKLQQEEVDWAGLLDMEEAEQRIFPRFKEVLKYLKEKR